MFKKIPNVSEATCFHAEVKPLILKKQINKIYITLQITSKEQKFHMFRNINSTFANVTKFNNKDKILKNTNQVCYSCVSDLIRYKRINKS